MINMVKAAEVATVAAEEAVNWGEAVLIFILGIGTVFAVLIILWAILALMKVFFAKGSAPEKAESAKAAPASASTAPQSTRTMSTPKKVATSAPENEDELVALLNGAVAAYAGTTNLRVKSYKKM